MTEERKLEMIADILKGRIEDLREVTTEEDNYDEYIHIYQVVIENIENQCFDSIKGSINSLMFYLNNSVADNKFTSDQLNTAYQALKDIYSIDELKKLKAELGKTKERVLAYDVVRDIASDIIHNTEDTNND